MGGFRKHVSVGEKYGRLTVVSPVGGGRENRWLTRCECGGSTVARGPRLHAGLTWSCGCGKRDALKGSGATHGMSKTTEYRTWCRMIERCEWPGNNRYARYGGRGISVAPAWRSSFAAFFAHMGLKPSPKHSIDRIDTNGNYEPGNCRWASPEEQQRNKTNNHVLSINGESATVAEWARRVGIDGTSINCRLRRGWSVEDAATLPPQAPRPRLGHVAEKRIHEKIAQYLADAIEAGAHVETKGPDNV